MMIKSPNYIIISSEKENNYIENSGFIASDIILKSTELGVNTCFITMSDRKTVSEILKTESNMEVKALISLGYKEKENKNISNNTTPNENTSLFVDILSLNTTSGALHYYIYILLK